ncbi:M14 family zinc carboxypeptidase [Xanthomarina gelatinilytica]|uniref:M14 family zinc carboxypeptidase n=1 Tax=Xanthomarina gelatinilytica TaxID=1137281 RepID=UPI003AA881DD
MTSSLLKNLFDLHKESSLENRYIHLEHITPLIENLKMSFQVDVIGHSVLGKPIHVIKIGTGPKKILMWSQMHGNESTTTKAVFDICNVFNDGSNSIIKHILETCTMFLVPMLNPDGSKLYTRHNANNVDLNRDAKNLSQPESRVLRDLFQTFKPDYCFNLHGQRTIFGAGNTANSATLSFLSPAQDQACSITETRKIAMEVIAATNKVLQEQIPNQIGRYDDAYNDNCVGDTFQTLNCPTILFEAGHFVNDYQREITRFYMFQAILYSIYYISATRITGEGFEPYLNIPENFKNHFDVLIRKAKIIKPPKAQVVDIAIQYQEILKNNTIEFVPIVEKIGDLSTYFGHRELSAEGFELVLENGLNITEGLELEYVIINSVKYSIKLT